METVHLFDTEWGQAGITSREGRLCRFFLPPVDLSLQAVTDDGEDLPDAVKKAIGLIQAYYRGERVDFTNCFEDKELRQIQQQARYRLQNGEIPCSRAPVAELFQADRVSPPGTDQTTDPAPEFSLEVPLDVRGFSPFARRVLAAASVIPYGNRITYSDLSLLATGDTRHARAVGGVMKHNPLPLFIPCHRVLARSGPGGFSGPGGVQAKMLMLALEADHT